MIRKTMNCCVINDFSHDSDICFLKSTEADHLSMRCSIKLFLDYIIACTQCI